MNDEILHDSAVKVIYIVIKTQHWSKITVCLQHKDKGDWKYIHGIRAMNGAEKSQISSSTVDAEINA